MFAESAIELAHKYQLLDEQILGHEIAVRTFVDGILGVSEYNARINSVIAYEFGDGVADVLNFIADELFKNSPVGSDKHPGQYKASHMLFADGVQVPISDNIPDAREYLFTSTLPYSRKIEDGESSQAPSGVYELIANQAAQRFGNAKIAFVDYVGIYGVMAQTPNASYGQHTRRAHNVSGNRYPAIQVMVK